MMKSLLKYLLLLVFLSFPINTDAQDLHVVCVRGGLLESDKLTISVLSDNVKLLLIERYKDTDMVIGAFPRMIFMVENCMTKVRYITSDYAVHNAWRN